MYVVATSSSLPAFRPVDMRSRRALPIRNNPITIVSCAAAKGSGVNFYQLLSLESGNVGLDEIKRAYRSKARECHPDVCPPNRKEEFTRMFVELHRAYETLSDPVSRRRYDCELALNEMGRACDAGVRSEVWREMWEDQLAQLKLRSDRRMKQSNGSWSGRVRSQRP